MEGAPDRSSLAESRDPVRAYGERNDAEEEIAMKSRNPFRRGILILALSALGASAASAEDVFVFDKNHTLVSFKIRHVVTKVEGRFRDWEGTIWIDRQNPSASKVELTIQAASIDTGTPKRDDDLRSENFFDVAKYPTITFKSAKVEPKGGDAYVVTGDLTMHGVTKPVEIGVKSNGFAKMGKGEKAGFEVGATLNRKDFGIVWNRTLDQGGMLLGDDVEVVIQVEANRKEPEAPKTGGR
jgi:polyisoprenoid-binding protein YceI